MQTGGADAILKKNGFEFRRQEVPQMVYASIAMTVLSNTATLVFHIVAILACIKYLRQK